MKNKRNKKEFIEDGLLTPQEVENITKAKIIDLNKEDKIIPSSNLSRSLSVNNWQYIIYKIYTLYLAEDSQYFCGVLGRPVLL